MFADISALQTSHCRVYTSARQFIAETVRGVFIYNRGVLISRFRCNRTSGESSTAHSGRGFLASMSDFKCCLGGDSVNNPSTLRRPLNPQFKQIAPVAPLGLRELVVPMYYTHIAPLGRNAPNSLLRLMCRFLS